LRFDDLADGVDQIGSLEWFPDHAGDFVSDFTAAIRDSSTASDE
jgi:hypothetical protein